MKKQVLFSLCLLATVGIQAQIGVNNTNPQASFHITPQKTDGTTAEGIIAPNLTRAQLIVKDARYTVAQKGAIVYVTTLDGILTAKTAQITAIGYYYFDGDVWVPFRQSSTIVPSEPWRVQGGVTEATGNNENIYQTGSVAIGSNSAGTYKLQVTGSSNITGNSRVGSSTVVGNEQVSGNLGVTGTTTISGATTINASGSFTLAGNGAAAGKYLASDASGKGTWTTLPAATVTTANNGLAMSGTTTQLGGALTKATTISGTSANTLTISAPSIISGALRISSGTPGTGKYLVSDASGNATWGTLPAATVTTANNGLAMSGTTTQLGGALTKATTISGTSANTLTISAPSIISGALRISSGTPGAGKYLVSDASGNATWGTLPATATTEPWQVQGGTTAATTNAQNIYQTGSVSIGSNTAGTYKFQVTGTSNVTGNSRVASSTVVGAQTVGTTLGVTGVATMSNNLIVSGNTGLGITTPAQKLHVVGNEYVTGISKVGGTTTLNTSAQIELGDVNKGFLPNRVALTNPAVKAPVANAVDGMMVYNTATVSAQGLKPGYYYWRNNNWNRLVDELPVNRVTGYDLTTTVNSIATTPAASQGGALMSFGDLGTTTKYFTIKEGGSYAFAIRVYGIGNPQAGKTMGRACVYFTLMINGVKIDVQEVNWALVDPAIVGAQNRLGGTVMLTGDNLKVGDKVEVRLAHYNVAWSQPVTMSANPGLAADKTSLVFWKL